MKNLVEKIKQKNQQQNKVLSLRNHRTLKLIPRIVAQHVVYRFATENTNPQIQQIQTSYSLQDQDQEDGSIQNQQQINNIQKQDMLPQCQNIGLFLNLQKDRNISFKEIDQILRYQNSFNENETLQVSQPKVVVVAIRIRNFYDEIGVNQARRFFDEQAEIERQADLSDKFLQLASEVIYKSNSGDLIQFFGDSMIACFQGQSDNSVAQNQQQKNNQQKKYHSLINIKEQDEEQIDTNRKRSSKQQRHQKTVKFDPDQSEGNTESDSNQQSNQSQNQEEYVEYTEENEVYDTETYNNLKTAFYSASKIYHLVQDYLDSLQSNKQISSPNQKVSDDQEDKKQNKEVQIGIGFGDCSMYHVGGVFGRTAFFAAGKALQEAQDCLKFAKNQNYQGIIVSSNFWRAYSNLYNQNDKVRFFKTRQQLPYNYIPIDINNKDSLQIYESDQQVKKDQKTKFFTHFQNEIVSIENSQREKIWPELLKYIPMYFRPFIEAPIKDQSLMWQKDLKQGNHMRILTIMALSLEIDGIFKNEESLKVLQETIEIIQKQIYRMRGSLSRISFQNPNTGIQDQNGFEGGIQIEAEWGQPGLPNDDNPSRACICAMNIQKALKEFIFKPKISSNSDDGSLQNSAITDQDSQNNSPILKRRLSQIQQSQQSKPIQNNQFGRRFSKKIMSLNESNASLLDDIELPIHFGITTGLVFQALVGHDESKSYRLERSVIGEVYTRANILLQFAQQAFGKIYIDYETMQQARSKIDVRYVKHAEIPNRFFNMPLFEPVLIDEIDLLQINDSNVNLKILFKQFESDFIKQGSLIKIQHNPLILDYNGSYQMLNNKIYDRNQQVKKIIKQIVKNIRTNAANILAPDDQQQITLTLTNQFNSLQNNSQVGAMYSSANQEPYSQSIVIRGYKGSGKSLFARNILINLKQFELLINQQLKQLQQPNLSKNKQRSFIQENSIESYENDSMFDFGSISGKNQKYKLNFRFCVGLSNSEINLQFLGIWRQIMRIILCNYANILDKKPKKILAMLIDKYRTFIGNKLDFVQEYFKIYDVESQLIQNIYKLYPNQDQMNSLSSFFEPARYQPDAEEDIMQFLFQIILDTFEQFEEITNKQQYLRDKERQKERAMGLAPSDTLEYPTKTALVFFLDNAQLMNESDWKFYMLLATNNQHPLLKNLVIILNIDKIKMYIQPQQKKNENPLPKSISNYELLIDQSAQNYYFNEIKDIEDELYDQIIDLSPINKDTIYKVLFNQSEIYQKQMSAEIDKRVIGQDADLIANTAKAENENEEDDDMIAGEQQDTNPDNELENLKSQLYRKYQVFAQYKSIDADVIDYIQIVSEGNPMLVLSYFHNLLIKGYLEIVEIDKEFKVVLTKKLRSALSYYDNNHISPQVQLPYEIFSFQSMFIDKCTFKLTLKAEAPYVVVACDYTLLVCSLIGSKFSSQILVESGACPEYFYASQFQKISIFKVLDLLEDCDFIEMFHEELIDSFGKKSQLNRFYRFNFKFLASVINQMKPFYGVKNQLHFALAEYFKSHQHLDASTDYKQSNDLKMLTRQLLENRRIIYQEKLNVESQQSILRKYITLLLYKMKQKKEEQQQQTSKNNHVVLLQSLVKIESDEVVKYMASIRKNKLFEISTAVEKIHELKIQLQVQINKDSDEEQFRLIVLKTQEQIIQQTTLGNDKNKDIQQETINSIQQINIEDIREIKETSSLKNVDAQQQLKQDAVASENKAKKIDSKKQSIKQENQFNNGESQEDNEDNKKDQDGKEVVADIKSKISNSGFVLIISFYNNHTQEFQEKADTIGLIFQNQKERIKWFTYLKYIKERLQFKYFTERFNDVPAIANNRFNKKDGQPNKPSDFFLNQGVSTTATKKQLLIDKMQLVKVQGSSNILKNKIGQALKNIGGQSDQYQTKAFQSNEQVGKQNTLFQQIQIIQQKLLDQKGLNKNEKIALQNKYYELQQKQTNLLKIKERLKIFYQFSVNQFCSHVAMTPLRPTIKTKYWKQNKDHLQVKGDIVYLFPSNLQQIPQKISNQISSVLQQYEILSERSSGRGEDDISDNSYIANEQDYEQQENEEQANSLKTDSYFQINEQEDLQIQLTEIVKNNLQETMRSYIQEQDPDYEVPLINSSNLQNNQWNRLFFQNEKKNIQSEEIQEVPYHLKVLRNLANNQKFIELAELKKNIENTQNIFYEQKRAIIIKTALPFEKPFVDPRNFRKQKDYLQYQESLKKYPKLFQEGPLVYKFISDEKEEIIEERESGINSKKKSIKSQISQQMSIIQQQNNHIISHEVQVSDLDKKLSQHFNSQLQIQERIQYTLKCQHSKKVFSDEEIQNFKLKRRKETAETRFDMEKILGIIKDSDNEDGDQKEIQQEMQNVLAYAISKVLDQKSSHENVNKLLVNEIQAQIQNIEQSNHINDIDENYEVPQNKLASIQIQVKQSRNQNLKKRQLRKDASQKLIQSLINQQNSSQQIKNILNSSLTLNFSKTGNRIPTQFDNGNIISSQKQLIQQRNIQVNNSYHDYSKDSSH